MAKGRRRGKQPKAAESSDEDEGREDESSLFESESAGDLEEEGENANDMTQVADLSGMFSDLLDSLREKRSSTRIVALKKLARLLSIHFCGELLTSNIMTMSEGLSKSLAKGDVAERVIAATVFQICAISLDVTSDGETLSQEFTPKLLELVQDRGEHGGVRTSSCDALAVSVFASGEVDVTHEVVKAMKSLWKDKSSTKSLKASAIRGWSLLVSTLDYDSEQFKAVGDLTKILIDDSSFGEVRNCAGEAIALLYERERDHQSTKSHSWESDKRVKGDEWKVELVPILDELTTSLARQGSRKDRKSQKSSFRQLKDSIIDGVPPKEKLSFGEKNAKQVPIEFNSWEAILHLNTFRATVGIGLNTHMTRNPFLTDVFDLPPFPTARDKGVEMQDHKRVILSQYAAEQKVRDLERDGQRTIRRHQGEGDE